MKEWEEFNIDEEFDFNLKIENIGHTMHFNLKNCRNKLLCKNIISYDFKILIKYNLHSMEYFHLFPVWFIFTLSCNQCVLRSLN